MYKKNVLPITSRNKKLNEIYDDFLSKRNSQNSILDSTGFTDVRKNLNMRRSDDKFLFSSYVKEKDKPPAQKAERLLNEFKGNTRRMDEIAIERNRNIDLLNYKYRQVKANNQVINFLPKFKKIYSFNAKVQNLFSRDISTADEPKPHKLNVQHRIKEYRRYLKYKSDA